MLEYLKVKFASKHRVSVERVVSGPGLANIYEFLRTHWAYEERVTREIDSKYMAAPEHMKGAIVAAGAKARNAYPRLPLGLKRLATYPSPPPRHAKAGDVVCSKVVSIFSECYGSEAGNAALKWLPYGGMYVSGGIGAKNPQWVQSEGFLGAYFNKGRLSAQVAQVPLYLVTTEDTGERGALFVAVSLLSKTGDIDRSGLASALKQRGKYESEQQVDRLMAEMDHNGDGRVELAELMAYMEKK